MLSTVHRQQHFFLAAAIQSGECLAHFTVTHKSLNIIRFQGINRSELVLQVIENVCGLLAYGCDAAGKVFERVRVLGYTCPAVFCLFVQDGTHGVPETVPSDFSAIANALKDLVYASFTHCYSRVVRPGNISG